MKLVPFLMLIVLLTGLLAGCATSNFNQPTNLAAIEQALASKGLQVCAAQEISGQVAIGIERGKVYDLDTNCDQYDPNKPGARVWAIQFSNVEARNGAFRRILTENRRALGLAYAWTAGSYVILVNGSQTPEVVAALKEAVLSIGAQ